MSAHNKTISQEDPAGPLTGAEYLRIVQGANDVRTTLADVVALVPAPAPAPPSSGGTDVAALLATTAPALRRAMTGPRNDNEKALTAAYRIYEGAKKTNTNGALTVWEPDAASFYGAMWARDSAMSMEAYLEYFTPAQIAAVLNYYLSKSNLATGEVPDHILHDGTVKMTPGGDGGIWGARAPIDGQMMLVQMAWLHFIATGSASVYSANRAALKSLIETGVHYSATTKAVNIPDSASYVGFGFFDSCEVTGDNAFATILGYRAFLMLAELEHALANDDEALRLFNRAGDLKGAIQSMLTVRAGAGAELAAPYFAKQMAYLYAGTVKGATQIDLWSTSYAVWNGMLTPSQEKMVGNFLLYAYLSTSDNVDSGGVRHVYKPSDYTPGTTCWQGSFGMPQRAYGTYQNGGYWPTATAWYVHALSKVSPADALKLYGQFVTTMAPKGDAAPTEWWSTGFASIGATKYLTSAAAYLETGDAPFKQASGSSGGSSGGGSGGVSWCTTVSDGSGDHVINSSSYVDSGIPGATLSAVVGDTLELAVSGVYYSVGGSQNWFALCLNGVPVFEFLGYQSTSVMPSSFTQFCDRVVVPADLAGGSATLTLQIKTNGSFYITNTTPSHAVLKIKNYGQ